MPKRLPQGEPSGLYAAVIFAIAAAVVACCGCGGSRTDYAILAFTSKHCAPCKLAESKLDWLSRRYRVRIVDVDSEPAFADAYGVVATPTYVVRHREQTVAKFFQIDHLSRYLRANP